MSAVINQAKQHYVKALKIEVMLLLLFSLGLFFWQANWGVSLLAGSFAAYLPFGLFVYWVFFKKSAKSQSKMTAFYWGEGVKWITTILLLIFSLKGIPDLHILSFFAGYFLALLLNNLIPFVLSKRTQ